MIGKEFSENGVSTEDLKAEVKVIGGTNPELIDRREAVGANTHANDSLKGLLPHLSKRQLGNLAVLAGLALNACSPKASPTVEDTPTDKPAATETFIPTQTAVPTEIPLPTVTATEVPTATAVPTETAVPLSQEVQKAIVEFNELGIDPASYTVTEKDGLVTAKDVKTGKEFYIEGKFDITSLIVALQAQNDLEPTNLPGEKVNYTPFYPDRGGKVIEYCTKQRVEFRSAYKAKFGIDPIDNATTKLNILMVNPKTNSWGQVIRRSEDDLILVYTDSKGQAKWNQILYISSIKVLSIYDPTGQLVTH
jgi:hypothetical protein